MRTSVQNAELQSRQTKLAVKQRQLELANRRAALAALTFENTDRQRHLQGNTAAARRAADEAHAARKARKGMLSPTERAWLARAPPCFSFISSKPVLAMLLQM